MMDFENDFYTVSEDVFINQKVDKLISNSPAILTGIGLLTAKHIGVSPIAGAVLGGALGGLIVGLAETSTDFNKK